VSHGDGAAGRVIDWKGREILNQGASTPNVQRLRSEADGEEGLVEVVGILDEELVNIFAGRIGRIALRNGVLTVFVRIDIGRRAGE
jgi:hypothetical protein